MSETVTVPSPVESGRASGGPSFDVVVEDLEKTFGSSQVIAGVDLTVAHGEIVALLGPSGCGKTTLLRSIAGLETPTRGRISLTGQTVFSSVDGVNVAVESRKVGFVFQSYALWPHLTVHGNIAYALKIKKLGKREIKERVDEVLDLVNLGRFADRYPATLSGGQQQRVALARCLAMDPAVVLLDEPLSNLDLAMREQMRSYIRDLVKRLEITAVYVTHDHGEAMVIADRIYVMSEGRVVESGAPEDLYSSPRHEFTSRFLGLANLMPLRSQAPRPDGGVAVTTLKADHTLFVANWPGDLPVHGGADRSQGVDLMIRPERITLSRVESGLQNEFRGRIAKREYSGSSVMYFVDWGGIEIRAQTIDEHFATGDDVWFVLAPEYLVPISAGPE